MNRPDDAAWNVQRESFTDLLRGLDGRLLIVVGVANGADARALHRAVRDAYDANVVPDYVGGFVHFVSGYLCASAAGLPDLGLILRDEIVRNIDVVEQATWLAALDRGGPALAIGADIDTGYGNEPSAIVLSCRQAHKQGAAYVQIEDQADINKSCGHLAGARGDGKRTVAAADMIERRLKPALSYARNQKDFSVMARTDARASLGIDEALRRAHAYAESGAQMIFVEAPEGDAELRRVAAELAGCGAAVVANMVEGSSKTPYHAPRALHEMGFDLALYPIGTMLSATHATAPYRDALVRGEDPSASVGAHPERAFISSQRNVGVGQIEAWNRLFGS